MGRIVIGMPAFPGMRYDSRRQAKPLQRSKNRIQRRREVIKETAVGHVTYDAREMDVIVSDAGGSKRYECLLSASRWSETAAGRAVCQIYYDDTP
jgi:hypothetical protein